MRIRLAMAAAAAMLVLMPPTARYAQAGSPVQSESFTIPSVDPGISLYVRNKRPAGMTSFSSEKTVLLLHGATFPSEIFDLPIEGVSMMDAIAQQGFDVYFVDVRGYGGSTRPAAMDQPPSENAPVATAADAANDLSAAIDHILKTRNVAKLNLIGFSWGTSIAGSYTSKHNSKVGKLVLLGPAWLREPPVTRAGAPIGAYRVITEDGAKDFLLTGVPADKRASVMAPGVFEQFWGISLQTDPVGSKMSPPQLRAPNGVIEEFATYWNAGKPYYDPGEITVPTLLIRAEWDQVLPSYQSRALFNKLSNVPYKRLIEIGEGSHFVLIERNRMQVLDEIMLFLSAGDAVGKPVR
jgi:pimeloyl-ACP methyl ester carboxylesterase